MNNQDVRRKSELGSFLWYLNSKTRDYVLYDDLALSLFYGLDRTTDRMGVFLKGQGDISKLIENFCRERFYSWSKLQLVQSEDRFFDRFRVICPDWYPIDIEVRKTDVKMIRNCTKYLNGITVYDLDTLCTMKLAKYVSKGMIDDAYDLSYLCVTQWNNLADQTKLSIKSFLEIKGVDYLEYVLRGQTYNEYMSNKCKEMYMSVMDLCSLRR